MSLSLVVAWKEICDQARDRRSLLLSAFRVLMRPGVVLLVSMSDRAAGPRQCCDRRHAVRLCTRVRICWSHRHRNGFDCTRARLALVTMAAAVPALYGGTRVLNRQDILSA
jgi:hypothetical protein